MNVNNAECDKFCNIAFEQMGNVNIYDIYVRAHNFPIRLTRPSERRVSQRRGCASPRSAIIIPIHAGQHLLKHLADAPSGLSAFAARYGSTVNNITLDACVEEHMADYLNIPAVQAAIHAIVRAQLS